MACCICKYVTTCTEVEGKAVEFCIPISSCCAARSSMFMIKIGAASTATTAPVFGFTDDVTVPVVYSGTTVAPKASDFIVGRNYLVTLTKISGVITANVLNL